MNTREMPGKISGFQGLAPGQGDAVHRFYQVSGLIIVILGFLWALGSGNHLELDRFNRAGSLNFRLTRINETFLIR
jgi:hypothetical protein